MTNSHESEFLRIESETEHRNPEWVNRAKTLHQKLVELRKQYSTNRMDNLVINVDEQTVQHDIIITPEAIEDAKINERLAQTQLQEIPELYKELNESSPIMLAQHHLQAENYSCTIASLINTLEALGVRDTLTEGQIATYLGETGRNAPIDLQKSLHYLRDKELNVEALWNVLDLIFILEKGGVVLLTVSRGMDHEVLVSGVDISDGQIRFRVNDPLLNELTYYSLEEMLKFVPSHFGRNEAWAVTRTTAIEVQ